MPNVEAVRYTAIREINPNMKTLNLTFIVLEVGTQCWKKDSTDYVRTVKIADRSGSIDFSVWNRVGDFLQSGDICRLHKGYPQVRNSCLSVSLGKYGELVKVGEFCMVFSEVPDMSARNPEFANFEKKPPHNSSGENRHGGGREFPNGNGPSANSGNFPSASGASKPQMNGNGGGFGVNSAAATAKSAAASNNGGHTDAFSAALSSSRVAKWSSGEKRSFGGGETGGVSKRVNPGPLGSFQKRSDSSSGR